MTETMPAALKAFASGTSLTGIALGFGIPDNRFLAELRRIVQAHLEPPAAPIAAPHVTTGKSVPVWTEAQVERLRAGYQAGESRFEIAQAVGHTVSAVGYKAGQLGLRAAPNDYTEVELQRLRELYVPGADPREVARLLGRPLSSVFVKAQSLGLSLRQLWTDQDKERLIELHAAGNTLVETARQLGRPYANVAKVAERYGLSFRRAGAAARPRETREPRPAWSEAELARLRELYVPGADPDAVAQELGRPPASVKKKASMLGLSLERHRPWTEADTANLVEQRASGTSIRQIALALNRTYASVARRIADLKLAYKPAPRPKTPRKPAVNNASNGGEPQAKTDATPVKAVIVPTSRPEKPKPAAPAQIHVHREPAAKPMSARTERALASLAQAAVKQIAAPPPAKPKPPSIPEGSERERQIADFVARNGVKREIDFGAHTPAVAYLREIGIETYKALRGPKYSWKDWLINWAPATTTELYKRVNDERKKRGLAAMARPEEAKV